MSSVNRLGLMAALATYCIWGSLPLYIRALDHIGAVELLAHRVVWSVPTALILLALAANWREVRAALTPRRLGWLALSGLLIGVNWMVYIWAVNEGRTMEASLGYYINPLVNVLFGMVFLSERLRLAQWVAVAIAAVGVAVMTIAFGRLPWIALVLCFTFAFYSVIRKQIDVDSRAGFLVEVAILLPIALLWFTWFLQQPGGRVMGNGGWDIALLLAAGPITATPLILFALAAKRLNLTTIGMLQYIGPTLQFLSRPSSSKSRLGGAMRWRLAVSGQRSLSSRQTASWVMQKRADWPALQLLHALERFWYAYFGTIDAKKAPTSYKRAGASA